MEDPFSQEEQELEFESVSRSFTCSRLDLIEFRL